MTNPQNDQSTKKMTSKSTRFACITFARFSINDSKSEVASFIKSSPFKPQETMQYLTTAAMLTKSPQQLAEFFGMEQDAANYMHSTAEETVKRLAVEMEGSDESLRSDDMNGMVAVLAALLGAKVGRMKQAKTEAKTPAAPEAAEPAPMTPEGVKAAISKIMADFAAGSKDGTGAFEINMATGEVTSLTEKEAAEAISDLKKAPDGQQHDHSTAKAHDGMFGRNTH